LKNNLLKISIETTEKPDTQWNARLLKSGLGTVYQSKEVALHFQKQSKNVEFLKFIDNKGNIVGQLFLYKEPYSSQGLLGKFRTILGSQTIYKWSYGPIIFNPDLKNEIYISLENYLLEKKCRVSGSEHPLSSSGAKKLKNIKIIPWATFLIDLKKTHDEIFNNFSKHNCQKNIKRSIKRGVIVEEITEKTFREYFELKIGSTINSVEHKVEFENLLNWWKILKPIGYSGFLARRDEKPIGGLLFSFMCGHIIEGGVARSKEDLEKNLYSHDLIKWKIIEWGVTNNMNYYNLAGYNPNPASIKEKGILGYKQKWGGTSHNFFTFKK
jgi:hypothetical protein